MDSLIIGFVVFSLYLLYGLGVLLFRFVRWLIKPILEAIQYRRIINQENRKEDRLLEEHHRTKDAIDQAVARSVEANELAMDQADRQPRPRQSG